MTSPIWKIPEEEFINIVKSCTTYSEILAHFGLMNRGNNHRTLKKRLALLNLSFSSNPKRSFFKKDIWDYLKKGTIVSNHHLKKRLIKEGLLKDECYECGLGNEWNGRKLSLHLDHINGDPTDNRLTNLRLLCPNCHSQTDNYCGKAKKLPPKICKRCGSVIFRKSKTFLCRKCCRSWNSIFIKTRSHVKKPEKEELNQLVSKMPITSIGRIYGVSGNAVSRWIKKYGLQPLYGRGYWAKNKSSKPSKKDLQKVCKKTNAEIASIYKINPDTVSKWFTEYGIKRPDGTFWANKRWKTII